MKLILGNQWIVNIMIKSECINKYIYVCIYMCVCVFMYIYTYIHICICTYILEKEIATHSSVLVWKFPWTEDPGRLESMVLERFSWD